MAARSGPLSAEDMADLRLAKRLTERMKSVAALADERRVVIERLLSRGVQKRVIARHLGVKDSAIAQTIQVDRKKASNA